MPVRIIIAESQKLFRNSLSFVLEEHEIDTIAETGCGEELITFLDLHPDLILLDIEVHGLNGERILNRLRSKRPDLRVVILSKYDDPKLCINYLSNGANAYIHKGSDINMLVEAVKTVNEKGFYYDNVSETVREIIENGGNANSRCAAFSKREAEIISLICEGKPNKVIADELHIVVKTVEAHRKSIYKNENQFYC